MRPTKLSRRIALINRLTALGFTYDEANQLRRIEMTLQRWAELECGDSNDYASWAIERDDEHSATCTQCSNKWYGDEALTHSCPKCGDVAPLRRHATGKPYMVRHMHDENKARRTLIADRERGALKRLDAIMARHPGLVRYQQTDPRGAALYILRSEDIRPGEAIDSIYTRGLAVCD